MTGNMNLLKTDLVLPSEWWLTITSLKLWIQVIRSMQTSWILSYRPICAFQVCKALEFKHWSVSKSVSLCTNVQAIEAIISTPWFNRRIVESLNHWSERNGWYFQSDFWSSLFEFLHCLNMDHLTSNQQYMEEDLHPSQHIHQEMLLFQRVTSCHLSSAWHASFCPA